MDVRPVNTDDREPSATTDGRRKWIWGLISGSNTPGRSQKWSCRLSVLAKNLFLVRRGVRRRVQPEHRRTPSRDRRQTRARGNSRLLPRSAGGWAGVPRQAGRHHSPWPNPEISFLQGCCGYFLEVPGNGRQCVARSGPRTHMRQRCRPPVIPAEHAPTRSPGAQLPALRHRQGFPGSGVEGRWSCEVVAPTEQRRRKAGRPSGFTGSSREAKSADLTTTQLSFQLPSASQSSGVCVRLPSLILTVLVRVCGKAAARGVWNCV